MPILPTNLRCEGGVPDECLFCRIAGGKEPARVEHATDRLVVFRDVNPAARVHLLIVPRQHIPTVLDLGPEDGTLVVEMVATAREFVARLGIGTAYRLVFNGGHFQHIPHLHWHLLAP